MQEVREEAAAKEARREAELASAAREPLTDVQRRDAWRCKLGNALEEGDTVTVNRLLAVSASTAMVPDRAGRLPLHSALACKKPDVSIIRLLCKTYKDSVSKGDPTKDENLPLHTALDEGMDERIPLHLLKCYAAAAGEAAKDGRLPLIIAIQRDATEGVVKKLLECFPMAIDKLIDAETCRLPLHYALEQRASHDIVQTLIDTCPNACEEGHNTSSLHYAVKHMALRSTPHTHSTPF